MKICMKMVSLKEYWIIVDLLHWTKKRTVSPIKRWAKSMGKYSILASFKKKASSTNPKRECMRTLRLSHKWNLLSNKITKTSVEKLVGVTL